MKGSLLGFIAFLTIVSVAAGPPAKAPDAAYRAFFDKWKLELIDDLKQNWVPLAGLFWLKAGDNTFGTADSNAILLPKRTAPARAGVFTLEKGEVRVKLEPGVQATIDNKPMTSGAMSPDVSGKATVLSLGHLRMHIIRRGERTAIRLKDLDSAEVRNYRGPVFFPIDLNYRVTATYVPSDGSRKINVPNVLGDVTAVPVAGQVRFTINNQPVVLTALGGDPQKGLSFVFADATSKTDTYPAGRFLESEPVVDGKVVLDFNKAYNPPCAVTPYATCPIAPKENHLSVAIPAGEKYDRVHAARH